MFWHLPGANQPTGMYVDMMTDSFISLTAAGSTGIDVWKCHPAEINFYDLFTLDIDPKTLIIQDFTLYISDSQLSNTGEYMFEDIMPENWVWTTNKFWDIANLGGTSHNIYIHRTRYNE